MIDSVNGLTALHRTLQSPVPQLVQILNVLSARRKHRGVESFHRSMRAEQRSKVISCLPFLGPELRWMMSGPGPSLQTLIPTPWRNREAAVRRQTRRASAQTAAASTAACRSTTSADVLYSRNGAQPSGKAVPRRSSALPPQQHPNGWQMETPCPRCHGVREERVTRSAPLRLTCSAGKRRPFSWKRHRRLRLCPQR